MFCYRQLQGSRDNKFKGLHFGSCVALSWSMTCALRYLHLRRMIARNFQWTHLSLILQFRQELLHLHFRIPLLLPIESILLHHWLLLFGRASSLLALVESLTGAMAFRPIYWKASGSSIRWEFLVPFRHNKFPLPFLVASSLCYAGTPPK